MAHLSIIGTGNMGQSRLLPDVVATASNCSARTTSPQQ
jgi:hypothetical protein